MRTIKFRAWDKEGKVMRDPSINLLIDSYSGNPYWQFGYDELKPLPNLILMQYTGLKDKNGKEIYEGDILEADKDWFELSSNVGIVGFNKGQFCVHDEEWDNSDYITNQKVEIIGNIYENKDLLT